MAGIDLSTDYLGLSLRTPLVASSSPLTGELDGLRRLEDAGASAAVLPSLFEEQLVHEALAIHSMLESGAECSPEASRYFPELEDYATGPDSYLECIARAREALDIPVIASLNGISPGGWVEHAREIEQAGASALELNLYVVPADPGLPPAEVEAGYRSLVSEVRAAVCIPLALKLSPFFTALAYSARQLVDAGANGLVLFNRFYQPDLDLDSLEVVPHLQLSCSEELLLPLRWIAILSGRIAASLAATSGIQDHRDVLRALLVGADVAMMASALLRHGPNHLCQVEGKLLRWMEEHEYASVRQLRGSMSQRSIEDPGHFERIHYIDTLRSYSSSS